MKKEIKIRNLSSDIVYKIDNLANKKNISREEYIRQLLETHVQSDVVSFEVNKYSDLVKNVVSVVEKNSELFQEIAWHLEDINYGKIKNQYSEDERRIVNEHE